MTYEKDEEGSNAETTTVNTTLNHRFWTEDGWKSAGTLEAGDKLTLADGNTATVTNVAYEDTHATVYNFEVEDFHTYYVGTESVLVHNNGGNCMKTASALAQGGSKGGKYSDAVFASQDKLISHYDKHGAEFKGLYNSADEYLQGARDVMNNGYKVEYSYKGETRIGFVQFMGNNSKGKAKFAFVGTNNEGYITTFHTESGKTFWKLLNNGENIPVINPK